MIILLQNDRSFRPNEICPLKSNSRLYYLIDMYLLINKKNEVLDVVYFALFRLQRKSSSTLLAFYLFAKKMLQEPIIEDARIDS